MNNKSSVVNQIFKLRKDFLIIALTGRTGSGCTTVGSILQQELNNTGIKSEYLEFNDAKIDNNTRKNRIIAKFIRENWKPFQVISASDIIFFYVLLEGFEDFSAVLSCPVGEENAKLGVDEKENTAIKEALNSIKKDFNDLHDLAQECNVYIEGKKFYRQSEEDLMNDVGKYKSFIFHKIPAFRKKLTELLARFDKRILTKEFQVWGNNIRKYDSILSQDSTCEKAPSCLAHKINLIIKMLRELDKVEKRGTRVVIDALRNPYEVLYFRERYSAFYLMSVNTTEEVRLNKLFQKGYRIEEVKSLDKEESERKDFTQAYQKIDIDTCIEMSDIHLTHDGTEGNRNRKLINQLFTYIALILHPGLIPPSPIERLMQVAYMAKLNSGCLSRQVGAAVTNEYYSVKSVGWNTVAEGQTPCSLRNIYDLNNREDVHAYSTYEKTDPDFSAHIQCLCDKYNPVQKELEGLTIPYCFKDIHNQVCDKQKYNQVHTRSLHAEENAFLQLAKYGNTGIKGGKLFTTASCCELCAKKAYQLGIKEIYYIDAYPGISQKHILECGDEEKRPEMILFTGAVGRAYINLYNPFIPLKDEIEARTGINVKAVNYKTEKTAENKPKEV